MSRFRIFSRYVISEWRSRNYGRAEKGGMGMCWVEPMRNGMGSKLRKSTAEPKNEGIFSCSVECFDIVSTSFSIVGIFLLFVRLLRSFAFIFSVRRWTVLTFRQTSSSTAYNINTKNAYAFSQRRRARTGERMSGRHWGTRTALHIP